MIKAMSLFPGLVCLLLGVVFLLVFRGSRLRQEMMDRNFTSRTSAKLVDTETKTEYDYNNKASTRHYGIYEFDTAAGEHITAASDFGYAILEQVPGETVEIYYNPDNPTEFYLPEEHATTEATMPKFREVGIKLIVLGVLLTIAAIAFLAGAFDGITKRFL